MASMYKVMPVGASWFGGFLGSERRTLPAIAHFQAARELGLAAHFAPLGCQGVGLGVFAQGLAHYGGSGADIGLGEVVSVDVGVPLVDVAGVA
jgi:hypothetical protein